MQSVNKKVQKESLCITFFQVFDMEQSLFRLSLCVFKKRPRSSAVPDMGNEKITGFNHSFVGLENGKSGMNGRIEGIKVLVKAIRIGWVQAGMIGLNVNQADMRMRCLCLGECAQGEAIERAVIADEEFGDAILCDVALDGAEQNGVEIRGCVGMTEEEAGLGRHQSSLPFNSLSALN